MALSSAEFLGAFPEFAEAPSPLVDAKLAEAERFVSRAVFGAVADDAVGNYAAHLIATNPLGERAKLIAKDGSTPYLRTFERLRRAYRLGPTVV